MNDPDSGAEKLTRKERWAVALLALMALFLYADQNLMAPNLTAIARDLGLDAIGRDVKLGGQISLAFWVVGGVVALSIGYLADIRSRKRLLVGVILLGEIPCLLTGFVHSFPQLLVLRALTGIGIGGALPLTFSLLGDFFPAERRAAASAYLGLAMGLGIASGQLLAGFLGPRYGWRLPFVLVALPNFVLAALFAWRVNEPPRGRREEALQDLLAHGLAYTATMNRRELRRLFRVPTNVLAFVQGIFGTVPWGVFYIYLNDFYAQEKGYSVEQATLIVMVIGAAAILGGWLGGLAGNALYNRRPAYLPLFCGAATLAGVVPTALLINYAPAPLNPSLLPPMLFGVFSGFLVAVTGPNIRAILLNVNVPEARGTIFSFFNLSDDLGKGLGPFVISGLILLFGRVAAFNVANWFWLICGAILLYIARTFPRDEQRMQMRLQQTVRGMHWTSSETAVTDPR